MPLCAGCTPQSNITTCSQEQNLRKDCSRAVFVSPRSGNKYFELGLSKLTNLNCRLRFLRQGCTAVVLVYVRSFKLRGSAIYLKEGLLGLTICG